MRACSTPAWDSASCQRLPVDSGPFHRRGYDTVWGLPVRPSLQAASGRETDGRIKAQETEKKCRNEWNGLHRNPGNGRAGCTRSARAAVRRLRRARSCLLSAATSGPSRLAASTEPSASPPGLRRPWRHVAVGRRGESHAEPQDACPHPAVRARPAAASRRGRAITTMIVIDNGNKEQQLISRHQSARPSGGSGQWSLGVPAAETPNTITWTEIRIRSSSDDRQATEWRVFCGLCRT